MGGPNSQRISFAMKKHGSGARFGTTGPTRLATGHPVHDFRTTRMCKNRRSSGSCARQRDSSDSPYVQRAQGSVEPRKGFAGSHRLNSTHGVVEDCSKQRRGQVVPRRHRRRDPCTHSKCGGLTETSGTMIETSVTSEN